MGKKTLQVNRIVSCTEGPIPNKNIYKNRKQIVLNAPKQVVRTPTGMFGIITRVCHSMLSEKLINLSKRIHFARGATIHFQTESKLTKDLQRLAPFFDQQTNLNFCVAPCNRIIAPQPLETRSVKSPPWSPTRTSSNSRLSTFRSRRASTLYHILRVSNSRSMHSSKLLSLLRL